MKSVLFILVCAVAVFVTAKKSEPSSKEIEKYMLTCAEDTGIDKGLIEGRDPNAKKPTQKQRDCFETCMMTKLKRLDHNGMFSKEMIRENSLPGELQHDLDKAKEVYEHCKAKADNDACDLYACMRDNTNAKEHIDKDPS